MPLKQKHKSRYHGPMSLDTGDREDKPKQRVPSPFILVLLIFYLMIAWIVLIIEDRMPRVISDKEIPKMESNVFSEESAKKYLYRIIGDEPRVAGTVYHFVKTRDLNDLVQEIGSSANIPISTDWQYATDDYWLEASSPHVNCYQNLSNIIAVLEGESGFRPDGSTGSSVLINCHYDSVPYAIGASDNGVFCAVMAEILSKLSRRKRKFRHNIVFLFNGAEETALQASHAFLSHPWAKGVRSVVNLDSAGMNGVPNVFQVTDPMVLASYQRTTSRPSAQSLGEVLFRSGIIPSDTDFRIFRDFGHIHGVDIAFVKWGNVYHTRNDEPSLILDGVVQNAGNMLLGLLKELADLELPDKVSPDELDSKDPPSPVVYFDYLTLSMVSCSLRAAALLDLLVAALGAASVLYYLWIVGLRRSSVRNLLASACGRGLCGLAGVLTVAFFTLVMFLTTTQMRYLSRQWLVAPLYWLPCALASVATSHIYDSRKISKCGLTRPLRSAQAMASTRLLITVLLLVLLPVSALAPLRYMISVPLAVMSVGAFISLTISRCFRITAWQLLLLDVAVTLPAVLLCLSMGLRMSALMLPVTGRSGSSCPDCTIAGVSALCVIITMAAPSGIELVFSRRRLWHVLGAVLAVCVVTMVLPLSPYEDDGIATQRHYWFHTQITSYDADRRPVNSTSGILVTKLDANSISSALDAVSAYNSSMEVRRVTTDDCDQSVYCDMPLYRPRFDRFLADCVFIRTEPPDNFPHELRLSNRVCERAVCNVSFTMIGPAHNTITIWPRVGVTLKAWSFASPPLSTFVRHERPVYVIVHAIDTYSEVLPRLEFNVTFEVQTPPPVSLADVSHHAHLIFHPERFTPEYAKLLQAMPKYFNVATFSTFRDNYVF